MFSVLAFKRSLSEQILDGASGEISFGGSRLNRFMKEVENVTGHMGEGETVMPAEEKANVVAAEAASEAVGNNEVQVIDTAQAFAPASAGQTSPAAIQESAHPELSDPWDALLQVGARFVSALAASGDATGPAHPWIERDPASGARRLKVPLPPPETAQRIADTLLLLAVALSENRSLGAGGEGKVGKDSADQL